MDGNGALEKRDHAQAFELALVAGDLSKLSTPERLVYYNQTCESIGLNPLTKPFEYISLNGKLVMYARKDCTDQLRSIRKVSVQIVSREQVGDVYAVTARATLPDGRCDESLGAVTTGNLKGDALANALMKAETKAKRRVTLSICGLGILDETEIETVPLSARKYPAPTAMVPISGQGQSEEEESDGDKIARWTDIIDGASSLDQLLTVAKAIKKENMPEAVRLELTISYKARQKELKEEQEDREPGSDDA